MQIVIEISEKIYAEKDKPSFSNKATLEILQAVRNGIALSDSRKCKWIHYDYRTVCPENHDIDNPYWRIPDYRMDALKYCPYCGKEIELDADSD